MDNQQDEIIIPDFRPDDERQEEDFFRALSDALQHRNEQRNEQAFLSVLQQGPSGVSVNRLQEFIIERLLEYNTRLRVMNGRMMRALLEYEPKIASSRLSLTECTFLHAICTVFECCIYAPGNVFEAVIQAYPEAVHETDSDGRMPLHCACCQCGSRDVVLLLLSQYPQAARIPDTEGYFPLHLALAASCESGANCESEAIFALIEAYPEATTIMTGDGRLPLHNALSQEMPFEIVSLLVKLYPDGVRTRDPQGLLPLHLACESPYIPVDIVRFLVEQFPDSVSSHGQFGLLPLHYAANRRDRQSEAVRYLVEVYPEAISTTDDTGSLPVHYACSAAAPLSGLQLLLDGYQGDESHHGGLSITNQDGQLPLHRYVSNRYSTASVFQHLMEKYRDGIHVFDRNGMLPLHSACSSSLRNESIIRLLVAADPFTVIQKTENGSTPYQLAWRMHAQYHELEEYLVARQHEVVRLLKQACAEVVSGQLGLPDLVAARVWSFAKPDL